MTPTTTTTTTPAPRTLAAIRRDVAERWASIVAAARLPKAVEALALDVLPKAPRLLGSSYKVKLGEALGVRSAVAYLAPAREAFGAAYRGARTLCAHATAACAAACLGHNSGLLATSTSGKARLWKAALWLGARDLFRELALAEGASIGRRAAREGSTAAVRLDGSSDTGEGERLADALAAVGVRTWDYTKSHARALRAARSASPYSLTYSHGGPARLLDSLAVLFAGGGVAVVFDTPRGEALPSTWQGFPVIDGDVSDARFLDRDVGGAPRVGGYVVGLRFKAARDPRGFLRRALAVDAQGVGAFVEPAQGWARVALAEVDRARAEGDGLALIAAAVWAKSLGASDALRSECEAQRSQAVARLDRLAAERVAEGRADAALVEVRAALARVAEVAEISEGLDLVQVVDAVEDGEREEAERESAERLRVALAQAERLGVESSAAALVAFAA